MQEFAWLIVLLAVAIIAAYFYIKRRGLQSADEATDRADTPGR
jgi:hypothetical protein